MTMTREEALAEMRAFLPYGTVIVSQRLISNITIQEWFTALTPQAVPLDDGAMYARALDFFRGVSAPHWAVAPQMLAERFERLYREIHPPDATPQATLLPASYTAEDAAADWQEHIGFVSDGERATFVALVSSAVDAATKDLREQLAAALRGNDVLREQLSHQLSQEDCTSNAEFMRKTGRT